MIFNIAFIAVFAVATYAFPAKFTLFPFRKGKDKSVKDNRHFVSVSAWEPIVINDRDNSSLIKLEYGSSTVQELKDEKLIPQNASYEPDQVFEVIDVLSNNEGRLQIDNVITPIMKQDGWAINYTIPTRGRWYLPSATDYPGGLTILEILKRRGTFGLYHALASMPPLVLPKLPPRKGTVERISSH